MSMSIRTQELLEAAGWSPGRCIDTTEIEVQLTSQGYTLDDAVVAFLREFSGLRVRFPHPRLKHITWFDLVPLEAVGWLYKADVDDYAREVGEPRLVPIGQLDHNMVLLLGPSGKMYGVFDDIIMQYGENGYEAMECLCRERSAKRLC